MNDTRPTIYFIREVPWDSVFPISTRMLAAEFARDGWNVVWLNLPLMPWHIIRPKELDYPNRNGCYVKENIFALTPSTIIPFSRHSPLDKPALANAMWRGCIPPLRRTLAKNDVPPPDLLFISHWAGFGIRHLYCDVPLVYHITDMYEGMSSVPDNIRVFQRNNLKYTDHAIVTAPILKQWLIEKYYFPETKITVVIHGVDYERFQRKPDEPSTLKMIPHPRLVVLGNMRKLPYDGLLMLARAIPDAHIILLGPVNVSLTRLASQQTNIHLLGAVQPSDVPAYLSASDVGLIAFGSQINAFVKGICPMKLFEYAAAGLPVVSTPLPVYETLDIPLWQANMSEDFVMAVHEALHAPAEVRDRMQAFALRNTWRQKYEECLPIVHSLLSKRIV